MAQFIKPLLYKPSMEKNYEIIDHTADIGIKVKGSDLGELFKNAALAVFQISSRRQYTKDKKRTVISLKQEALSPEELFVNWLNELLSLSAVKGLIFHDIKVKNIDPNHIEALCVASSIENYKVNIEIKAATYHQLKIEHKQDYWQAEVILDV